MKLGYLRMDDGVLRPVLNVRIHGPARIVPVRMLVDSGSDETLLPEGVLRRAGIPLSEPIELIGMGGNQVMARAGHATLGFGGITFPSRVVGSPDFNAHLPLLGRRDFFEAFRVTFDSQLGVLTVEPFAPRAPLDA